MQLADSAVSLENVRIAWVGSVDNQHLRGMSLARLRARRTADPADAMCDLLIEENLAVTCVWHLGDDALVEPFLAHPQLHARQRWHLFSRRACASAAISARPRGILGPLVRERRLFTLEEAVRKMTSIPAARFGLTDRGAIEPGHSRMWSSSTPKRSPIAPRSPIRNNWPPASST